MSNKIPSNILAKWKVLVVDDEPDSLIVATHILKFYGADVITATNGREGFELASQALPRFIISDISMPEVDGWELIKLLYKSPKTREIPVIALTAHAMTGDREKAISAGFYNYLTKPLNAQTFIHELLNLLVNIPEFSEELAY